MLTRVGDEHNGRFVRETLAAEGVDVSHVSDRPAAPHRAGVPLHQGPRHLPAHLLSPRLRRHGDRAGGLRRRPSSARRRRCSSRARISRSRRSPRRAFGDAMRAARKQVRLRHRLPPGALGAHLARAWASSASSPPGTSRRSCRRCCRSRPHHRHRGGVPHRRRDARTPKRRCSASRGSPRPSWWSNAAPLGCSVHAGEASRSTGKGFPVEVFNILGAGDGFAGGFLSGWLQGPAARGMRAARQRLRRAGGLAPRLRAGDAVEGGARALPVAQRLAVPPARLGRARARASQDHRPAGRGPRCSRSPSIIAGSSRSSARRRRSAPSSAWWRRRCSPRRKRRDRRRPLRRGGAVRAHRQRHVARAAGRGSGQPRRSRSRPARTSPPRCAPGPPSTS